jgi:anti-sigma factor RsiW
MVEKRQAADDEVICIRTDARCTNKKHGRFLGGYLSDDLPPNQKLTFERHRRECIACDTTVLNWENLRIALARKRADGNPEPGQKACAFKAAR